MEFREATKNGSHLRLVLSGPPGSGKTYSALAIAEGLCTRGKIALIDTEHGSAGKYADIFAFDTLRLDAPYSPQRYIEAMRAAAMAEYEVLIIDSLSHEWSGQGGILEMVDVKAKATRGGSSFNVWAEITPIHQQFVETILASPLHIIGTLRTKVEYAMETNAQGKVVPRKIGLTPIQRDGLEYEFDVIGELSLEQDMTVTKSRCPAVSGIVVNRPGAEFGKGLAAWLTGAIGEENGRKLADFAVKEGWGVSALRLGMEEIGIDPNAAFASLTLADAKVVKQMLKDSGRRDNLLAKTQALIGEP